MGSVISSSVPAPGPCSGDLPENCITTVLMFMDPPEICRLALLTKSFRSTSSADVIWESELPPNYHLIVGGVIGEDPDKLSEKEIYARIRQGCCFDGSTKEAFLDRFTGNFCISMSLEALKITGINDRILDSYSHRRIQQTHLSTQGRTQSSFSKALVDHIINTATCNHGYVNVLTGRSLYRFQTVAYLQQMWWVEVAGELDFHFQPGSYHVYFRLQLRKPSKRFGMWTCNIDLVPGWEVKPARFQLSTSDGQHTKSQCYLERLRA